MCKIFILKKIIIAIDGFSSCGKSTLAKALSKKLSYGYIDTGAMYRAVTFYFISNNIDIQDITLIQVALNNINIHFENVNGENHVFLNNIDIETEIRGLEVSNWVSEVSAISAVRKAMVKQQKLMGLRKGIVMDGRDIGTVVFPDAELKIFLTAQKEIRIERRYQELLSKGLNISRQEIENNLNHRDFIDSTRLDSPLRKAEDAKEIDNSYLTENEQFKIVLELANNLIFATVQ